MGTSPVRFILIVVLAFIAYVVTADEFETMHLKQTSTDVDSPPAP